MATSKHHNTNCILSSGRSQFLFHPFEIAFSGYSGSGKTTLITQLIKRLSSKYTIGYVKHDAHQFKMDREGKDTDKAWKSGASKVFITDSEHTALLSSGPTDFIQQRTQLINCDCVIVEGYKEAPIDKILVLDEEERILSEIPERVIACVGKKRDPCFPNLKVPYFHRDDVANIFAFIKERFASRIYETPVFGLVMAGGYSKRMQTDKALLDYHGKPQAEICYKLLSNVCEKVFLSVREGQYKEELFQGLPKLYDRFLDFGPLGGILSAMMCYPLASWLVLACDLPYIDSVTLQELIKKRDPLKMATAYLSAEDGLPEPMCAIYEPKSRIRLLEGLSLGFECPRKILIHSPIKGITLNISKALNNVNEKDAYKQAKKQMRKL